MSFAKFVARIFAAGALVLGGASVASAAPPREKTVGNTAAQDVTTQCTTGGTGWDGRRKACDSQPTTIRAPEGYVFVVNKHTVRVTSANGSENDCRFSFDDPVEVVPGTGITQPRSFTAVAHARSPKGHSSGRGWTTCAHHLEMVSYKRPTVSRPAAPRRAKKKMRRHRS